MPDLGKMNALINELSDEPFKYGKNDCYIFTAKLVKEWHGKDFLSNHAVYRSKTQADEYMAKFGGIERLTNGTLGYSVEPELCSDGDVAMAEVTTGQFAVGFIFNGSAFFKTKKKPIKIPLSECRRGWRLS